MLSGSSNHEWHWGISIVSYIQVGDMTTLDYNMLADNDDIKLQCYDSRPKEMPEHPEDKNTLP
jgi:hypothetical protein